MWNRLRVLASYSNKIAAGREEVANQCNPNTKCKTIFIFRHFVTLQIVSLIFRQIQQATAPSVPANPMFPYTPPLTTFVPNIPAATQAPPTQPIGDLITGVSQVTLDQTPAIATNTFDATPTTSSTPAQGIQKPEAIQSNVNELFASVPASNASPSLIETFQGASSAPYNAGYAGGAIQNNVSGEIQDSSTGVHSILKVFFSSQRTTRDVQSDTIQQCTTAINIACISTLPTVSNRQCRSEPIHDTHLQCIVHRLSTKSIHSTSCSRHTIDANPATRCGVLSITAHILLISPSSVAQFDNHSDFVARHATDYRQYNHTAATVRRNAIQSVDVAS